MRGLLSAQRKGPADRGCDRRLRLGWDFLNMREQFLLAGQAAEVVTDHLAGAQCWFATGPQRDQQAGDDAQVCLNGDAVFAVAQQVATAQYMFEESEECLDSPAMLVDQRDDLGRNAQQVGEDEDRFPLRRTGVAGTASCSASRCTFDFHDAQHTLAQSGLRFPASQAYVQVWTMKRPCASKVWRDIVVPVQAFAVPNRIG